MNGVNSWTRKAQHKAASYFKNGNNPLGRPMQGTNPFLRGPAAETAEFYTHAGETATKVMSWAKEHAKASLKDFQKRVDQLQFYIRSQDFERDLDEFAKLNQIHYDHHSPEKHPWNHPKLETRLSAKSSLVWTSCRDKILEAVGLGNSVRYIGPKPQVLAALSFAYAGFRGAQMALFAYQAFGSGQPIVNEPEQRKAAPPAPEPVIQRKAPPPQPKPVARKAAPAPKPKRAAAPAPAAKKRTASAVRKPAARKKAA